MEYATKRQQAMPGLNYGEFAHEGYSEGYSDTVNTFMVVLTKHGG